MVRERAAQVVRARLREAARHDPEHGERRGREQADEAARAKLEQTCPQHRERDAERDRTAAVRADPVVRHHDEAEDAEQDEAHDPEASPREERAGEERCEQQRLDLVADPPEARVLGRAERVHRLPLRPRDHDEGVERDHAAVEREQGRLAAAEARERERDEHRPRRDRGTEEHLVRDLSHAEGEVDEQRGRDRGHRRAQAEQREGEQDSREDEQDGELEPVVRTDRLAET